MGADVERTWKPSGRASAPALAVSGLGDAGMEEPAEQDYVPMTEEGGAPVAVARSGPAQSAEAAASSGDVERLRQQQQQRRAADAELDPVEMMEQDEALALALALSMEPDEPPPSLTAAPSHAGVPPPPPYPAPSGAEASGSLLSRLGTMVYKTASRVLGEPRKPEPGDHVRSEAEDWLETEEEAAERAARLDRQHATVLNAIRVVVPEGPAGSAFEVRTPDGTSVRVARSSTRGPGSALIVPYDGEPLTAYDACSFDDEAEAGSPLAAEEREAAFLAYYRFRPFEVETQVTVAMGARPLGGCKLVEGDEGVFVASAVVPYTEDDPVGLGHALRAGDLLTSFNGEPVESLAKLREQIAARPLGSKVTVRALRVPGPLVRCPQGHMLRKEWVGYGAPETCVMCKSNFGRHRCAQCAYELCPTCFWRVYRSSKVRRPAPVNSDAGSLRETRPGTDLLFSAVDVGTILLVFWYSTGEWWVGQVADFDPARGHTVVYETPAGGVAREVIYDMSLREYRVLAEAPLRSPVPGFRRTHMPSVTSSETPHASADVAGALAAAAAPPPPSRDESGLAAVFDADARGLARERDDEGRPAAAAASTTTPERGEPGAGDAAEGGEVDEAIPLSEDEMALLDKLRGQLETS